MKKVYFILMLAVAVALSGCRKFQEDVFDESSSERVQNLMDAAFETLTSSEEGWFFEYYPGWDSDMEAGGYWYWCNFRDDRTMDVAIEIDLSASGTSYPAGTLVTSSPFDIVRGRGAVLSFNIKNPIMDLFAEPSSASPSGMQGDLDFSIVSVTENLVTVKGIKTNKLMNFYRKTSDKTIPEAMKEIQAAGEKVYFSTTFVAEVKGTVSASAVRTERYFELTYTYEKDGAPVTETVGMPSVQTLDGTGIQFIEPVEVMGVEISGFRFDEENARLVSNDAAETVVLSRIVMDLNKWVTSTVMDISNTPDDMCAEFRAAWTSANASVAESDGETFTGAQIRPTSVSTGQAALATPSIVFTSSGWDAYFLLTMTTSSTDKVAIAYTGFGLNGNYPGYTTAFLPMAQMVAAKSPYTLTSNNPKNPKWIRYTSDTDSSFYFTTYF